SDEELKRVDCYETQVLLVFVGYAFVIFFITIVFLVLLTLHIFILLRDTSISMSEKTKSYHRNMTKALIAQVCSKADAKILYSLTFISIHSFMHASVVLGTSATYRKALKHLI
ncbi:hypothetical protein PENTCL1PPCAC_15794, partial [Pristionchus entomophagus]